MKPLPLTIPLILSTLLAVAFYIPGQHLTRTHRPGSRSGASIQ